MRRKIETWAVIIGMVILLGLAGHEDANDPQANGPTIEKGR